MHTRNDASDLQPEGRRHPTERDPAQLSEHAHRSASLRRWGTSHPRVLSVMATLPADDELDADGGVGWETTPVPGITLDGELRVSILRVFSHSPEGRSLVGQVQARCTIDHPIPDPALRWYVHDPERWTTWSPGDLDAWFSAILERHYARDGKTLALELVPPGTLRPPP